MTHVSHLVGDGGLELERGEQHSDDGGDKRGAYTRLFAEWSRALYIGGERDAAGDLEPDLYGTAPSPPPVELR